MTDMSTIAAALQALKTANEIARWLRESDVSLEKAETKLRLAELVNALADMKVSLAETRELIEEKDATIRRLKEALELKGRLVRYSNCYYETDERGQPIGDPYCSRCWEVDHLAVHVNQDPENRAAFVCPSCKSRYRWHPRPSGQAAATTQ